MTPLSYISATMQAEFPKIKEAILEPTNEQYNSPRAMIDFDELKKAISSLKPRVALGLGDLRNEHLTVLLSNDWLNATLKAKYAFSSLRNINIKIAEGGNSNR